MKARSVAFILLFVSLSGAKAYCQNCICAFFHVLDKSYQRLISNYLKAAKKRFPHVQAAPAR